MAYLVIVDITPEKRIAKLQEYKTRQEADDHIARCIGNYPNAFVIDNPLQYREAFTTVDLANKTLVYDETAANKDQIKLDAVVEIERLEGTVTARRIRDALASDEGKVWVALVEEKIKVERDKL